MKYKSIIAVKRGGPEMLHIQENELRQPARGESRLKVLAAPVCQPDIQARYGQSPFVPKFPFVPGYAVIGDVDAIGEADRDHHICVGDRVAALTVTGGYSEYIFVKTDQLIPVPAGLNPAEAAILILNYLVAYQVLHRVAQAKTDNTMLIIGASGGIGTAFLQLGKLAGLKMYGLASQEKQTVLAEYGAIPIDYRKQNFVEVIRQKEPDGIDIVADGMGGDYLDRGLSVLRRGGVIVEYGNTLSFPALIKLLGKTMLTNLLPNGKTVKLYGTGLSQFNRRPFMEDWETLFSLLTAGKIKPVIDRQYPILEARAANTRLESGKVIGNIVLLSPELL